MPPSSSPERDVMAGPVTAILNTASGSWNANCVAQIRALFLEADLARAEVVCVPPGEIEAALDAAMAHAGVVVVLGGDGTIRTAAAKAFGKETLLIPLPGGTMNMLPKALYGERPWAKALADTLRHPVRHSVSGGRAGGHAFFVAALLGAPTLWADAREAARAWRLLEAAKRSVTATRRSLSEPLAYAFGATVTGTAEAIAVVCPLISKVMHESERGLEAAAIDTASAGEALRLGFHALFDDWRQDASVTRCKVTAAKVTGHGRVPVILDGERVRMGREVLLDFIPHAFTALVPEIAEAPPARAAPA